MAKQSPWAKVVEKSTSDTNEETTENTVDANEEQASVEQSEVQVTQDKPLEEEKPLEEVKVTPTQPTTDQKEIIRMDVRIMLGDYLEKMKPGRPISSKEGGQLQHTLFTTMRGIIVGQKNYEDFKAAWDELLKIFREHIDQHFADQYVYRFPYEWPGGDKDYILFRNLVALCQNTCDPNARAAFFASTNLNTLFDVGLTEDQKQKLFTYYQL